MIRLVRTRLSAIAQLAMLVRMTRSHTSSIIRAALVPAG